MSANRGVPDLYQTVCKKCEKLITNADKFLDKISERTFGFVCADCHYGRKK